MGSIIDTPLSPPPPHMVGPATGLIARDSFLLDTASRASRSKARRQKHESCCLEQVRTDLLPCSVWPPRTSAIGRCPACSVSVRYGAVLFPRAKVTPPPPETEMDTSNKHGSISALPTHAMRLRPVKVDSVIV